MKTEEKIEYIIEWLKSQLKSSKMKGFVIGISGGIDSAVTSLLCAKTGLPTLLVGMPIHRGGYDAFNDAFVRSSHHKLELRKDFENVETTIKDLSTTYNDFCTKFTDNNTTEMALVNSKARLRMTALYQLSAARGYLVVGTGNKVEDFGIGFYSKYGDGGVDISPIADLYKSEVYELARELGVSEDILNATPSDDLWDDNRSDEDQIGATYNELENIMKKLESRNGRFYSMEATDREKEVMEIYSKHRNKNMHKMLPIPVCIIPKEE
jgi:NAD+ synthase